MVKTFSRNSLYLSLILGAIVNLTPPLTGALTSGFVSSGLNTELNIPLAAGTRVLVIFTATATGTNPIQTIIGYGSVSLTIN